MAMMEKKMETTIVYWGNLGIMQNVETSTMYYSRVGL